MSEAQQGKPSRLGEWLIPIAVCVLGLFLAFYPMLLSGFGRMMTDPGDSRFNAYVLEHGYRWITGDPLHRSFWDPPIFFPAPNTAAYSDVLLGVAPFYWVWRWAGVGPDAAFQYWMLTMSVLTYLAAYLPLRRTLRVGALPAAMGAFLFAFGSSRLAQVGHQQLLGHFYAAIAVWAVIAVFEAHQSGKPWQARGCIVIVFVCLAAQLWAGYYLGWFLGLGLGVGVVWALVLPAYRRPLLAVLRAYPFTFLAAAGLCALLLLPLGSHYLAAAASVSRRKYIDAFNTMPHWSLWLYQGADNWLYGWTRLNAWIPAGQFEHEKQIGIGLVALGLVGFGLWKERELPIARLLALGGLTLILVAQFLSHERVLCKWYFFHFPGAYSVRVVSRLGLLMLIPAAVGMALALQWLLGKRRLLWLALCTVVVLEQGRAMPSYDRRETQERLRMLAAAVDPQCDAFLITPERGNPREFDVDAMWVSLLLRKRTVNGYSGNQPKAWPLVPDPGNQQLPFEARLSRWLQTTGHGKDRICWVSMRSQGPPRVVTFIASASGYQAGQAHQVEPVVTNLP